ncbi:peptidylprolyl isomerase SurA [Aliidiomarina maris]|uniref:Chaperone SurA n=1 Tax=Aliidiomarina maris TaxID=531312 RepID=A0A327WST9_9GAMM|nr:peptidylprolyl isomerase SurA [Aliidiomarina maris]MCL5050613.1 peptidylprolyl isomerase SurA [Bacillota bacterium]RAJ94950.1 periplasmic chaperone for outer membrane proteins SurA [Aliidiomarina maris]RUO22159.1 peptidylprolyl isomerase SurA [Aliidiomarina maris]
MKVVTSCLIALSMWAATSVTSVTVAQQKLDSVAVIVDNTVVLESEVDGLMRQIKRDASAAGRRLPSDQVLRTQVSERLILQKLQMQMADRMGIRIGDAQLDQTIAGIAADNNMPIEALQAQVEADGTSWRQYREEVREQLITNEVQRAQVQRRVYISPQEINNLVRMIDEQGDSTVEYNLSHILISFQNEQGDSDEDAARRRVDAVVNRLNEGDDFAQMAVTSSSAANALDGGEMGWMSENTMPTLFAANVSGAAAGDIIGPLRSGVGFHVLRVNEVRGAEVFTSEEVSARHILIQPSVILSDNRARNMLAEFRSQIQSGEKTFGELAREHSADPGSARNNGELGFADPSMYVPEFRQRVEEQDVGYISEPFRTTHGWHIVEVLDRRTQDVTDQRKREQAGNMLYSRKFREELDIWLQEIRDNAYVEVLR